MDRSVKLGFPQISTVFDHDKDSPHGILYSSSIRNTLMRLLPSQFFLLDEAHEGLAEEFARLLPIVKWAEWGEQNRQVSIYLLCRHRVNGVKFFYEMISRWLMPGKRPSISSFFATDFRLPELSGDLFTICEIVISLEHSAEQDLVRHQMPIIESEIKLGLISVYHASRILEIKGLSADEKTSLIQERISSLLERRPKDFDHDIFAQMQHFLVMCSEEFKAVREYAHMSRIIYVFYLFRKALKRQIEKNPGQRFVHVKVSKTYLHLAFGLKKVLGVFAALNFQGDNELFEERHFIGAMKSLFPQLEVVEDSFFFRTSKEDRTQLLYLEVEKPDGTEFSLSEIRRVKESLPDEIRNGVEKLTRPLFMPRNEEEVMRNIITLSNQLKFSRDLPQVIITFDEQTEAELSFTVIWLRVLKETDVPIQDLFDSSDCFLKYIPDRIKSVGLLRKKHTKEVTVFRVKFAAQGFLRSDHSVDLFKARQALVLELQRILGEFRDYNGGMIAKQHEQFLALKELFSHLDKNEELLLENFFHSIFPIELRSLFNPLFLKNLFGMFLDAVQKGGEPAMAQKSSDSCCYILFSYADPLVKETVLECVRSFQIPSSQLLTISTQYSETYYLGAIYLEEDRERREKFLKGVAAAWENLTFEGQTSYH
ncbi:MAG: hypothetical protein JSS60_06355 [Verrucomicrobia bacterium]|nr:hypothetical protein [Verrucomicrobiota bacterium]